MDTPIIKVVTQRHPADCGVATLAMLLGVTYEDALVAIAADEPDVLTKGVWMRHLESAALRLGHRLRRKRRYDMETDTGILNLSSRKLWAEHVVILREGLIVETDGSIWDAADYLGALKAKPGTLLIAEAA